MSNKTPMILKKDDSQRPSRIQSHQPIQPKILTKSNIKDNATIIATKRIENVPCLQMKKAERLMVPHFQIDQKILHEYLDNDNTDFLVVGVCGQKNVGKSTLMNIIANQNSDDKRPMPFQPEEVFQTNGVAYEGSTLNMFITTDRVVLLDTSPLLFNVQKRDMIVAECDDIKTIMVMLQVCHLILVVHDGCPDLSSISRIMTIADQMVPTNKKRPTFATVYNKVQPGTKPMRVDPKMIKGTSLTIPDFQHRSVNLHHDVPQVIQDLQEKVYMMKRWSMAENDEPFTEKKWAQKLLTVTDNMKNEYFLRKAPLLRISELIMSCIELLKKELKKEFPSIDKDLQTYVEDVLSSSVEDFETSAEIYEAVGEILHEIAVDRTENDIRELCDKFHMILKSECDKINTKSRTILDSPILLGQMSANHETDVENMTSIWVQQRNDSLKVDAKKLEKAEAKIQQKQGKRDGIKLYASPLVPVLQTASASQVLSKKDAKVDAKGQSRSMDIRIENFDVSFGDRVLLTGADLLLAGGRRYGLVGRNGLGKTTLLRMISEKQLQIPSHISILHVEQEVVGNDTLAIASVLECDEKLNELWRLEKELSKDPSKSAELSEVYAQLQLIEADKAPSRASIILNGLGFNKQMQGAMTRTFSGGWRMRLALARALFSRPDLLLLDEPTNMLDIKAIIWLEKYLQVWPTTLLVVSHDRNFLDTVPTDILYLHTQRIDSYRGNYENFERTRSERLKSQRREWEAQMAHRAHVQEFIDRFRYNANRAASVQSKIKMLEKLPELKPVEKETEVVLKFPEVDYLNPPVLTMDEVTFRYPSTDRIIFSGVNLGANTESRICIVGENGAGKTTLLKIIMGLMAPTSGILHHHRGLKFGYFSQHHVDQLEMNVSCVELLQRDFPGKTIEEYRRQLGSFGVGGEMALQIVATLSGGQKSRVAFAKMCMANPNFLVLDEPTNHLDIESIEALGKAITKFTGGVILVSHDERLIRMVCKELWVCASGTVKSMEGGFDEYRKCVEAEIEAAASGGNK